MQLVQMMAQLKTENMKLKLKCREQDIRISHMESQMPGLTKQADDSRRPEATPE